MTIAEGFSIFGSLASAGAILLGLWTFHKERKEYLQEKEDDKKLQTDSMNRLLAHRAIPLCHKIKLLCDIYIAITSIKHNKVYFYSKGKIKEIRLAFLDKESNEIEYFPSKLPRDYQKLSDDTLLTCAVLTDRNNELLTTAIRINNGTEGIETILENACIHAENTNLQRFHQLFLSQEDGKNSLLSFIGQILNDLKVLEPEISVYPMYGMACATFNDIKENN